jgi:hypothetical protein
LAYSVYAVNLAGAAGSTTYRVEVSSRDDPGSSRVLYDGPGPPYVTWHDDVTLQIGTQRLDALHDTDEVFYERGELILDSVVKLLFVVMATAATALAAALLTGLLFSSRDRMAEHETR